MSLNDKKIISTNADDGIHEKKRILQESLRQSGLSETQITFLTREEKILANIAREEIERTGTTTVICPKCQTSPKSLTNTNDNRYCLRCECGYIGIGEVIF